MTRRPAAHRDRALPPFTRRVLQVVSRIPAGRVATYGDVARMAGQPRAARAVGAALRAAARPGLPYHRVIAATGRLGGFGGRVQMKAALLAAEGVIVRGQRVIDFPARRWPPGGRTAVKAPRSAAVVR